MGPGTWHKLLRMSDETGPWTALLKLGPESVFARHRHKGAIDFYTIKGQVGYRNGVALEGDYAYEPLGVLHEATTTTEETILFTQFYGPVEFIDEHDNLVMILDWAWVKQQQVGQITDPQLSTVKEPATVSQ